MEIMQIDGVPIVLETYDFVVGSSFFVPSFNPQVHAQTARKSLAKLGYKTTHRVVIEDGVLGFRIWRVS